MRQPASAYRQLSVESATLTGLVVMLYDGAITALQRAMAAIDAKAMVVESNHHQVILRTHQGLSENSIRLRPSKSSFCPILSPGEQRRGL